MEKERFVVAIVDDAPFMRGLVKNIVMIQLKASNIQDFKIVCAGSLAEYEELIRTESVNLAFVDMILPEGPTAGLTLLKKIRELHPSCEIVIISSIADRKTKESCAKFGCTEFIEKPFDNARISAAIERALKTSKVA
ncbi:MAG: response regulator [Chlamydiales bacterium]|nr:response regulator [Chlamydiales bacterium]